MMKTLYLLPLIFLLFSCNGELSRSQAEDLLIKGLEYPQAESHKLVIKDGSVTKYYTLRTWEKYKNVGLLTYSDYGTPQSPSGFSKVTLGGDVYGFKAELTPKGKEYFLEEVETNIILVKLADIEFGKITGVKTNPERNTAQVEYTVKRSNITPFGELQELQEETIPKYASFEKYDDGWRLHKPNN
jgi:hypothetical protein